jgi:hypothetical protein
MTTNSQTGGQALDPATSAFFRSLPLAVKILLGMNYALISYS